jgi:hypothetical protein
MLVVRGVDDEAGLTLAAAAIANRISFFFFKVIGGGAGLLICVGVARYGVTYLPTIAVLICVLTFACLLFAGLAKSFVGRELVYGSLSFHIKSHSTPDHIQGMSVITLSPAASDGLLRHAIYSHQHVIEVIVGWIKKQIVENPVTAVETNGTLSADVRDRRADGE